ncbi:hypothetical protein G8C92_21355 [Paenibacillus donghaensis]|uniref:hypothetical protein n=1 Tax=Paenibacillus donghaensis TaxID=414771 RepID=UPI001883D80F|nr:hypothetical protein [Paenibacillus donghaensis]MBE9916570.1 hypothetical protein [Paenibacillus donghaensis]
MRIRFLGTAAFEGIPSLFCRCGLCLKAKELGGKEIRSRTSMLLDDDLKIDFPPDTFLHMVRDGLDLERIKDLIFTHSHSDHLYAEDLVARLPGYAQSDAHPIQVYGNDAVLETKQFFAENGVLKPEANIVVTHFSHNGQLSHSDLTEIFTPHGIQVAYDGMVLELP